MSDEFDDPKKERRDLRAKLNGLRHVREMIDVEMDALKARVQELNATIEPEKTASDDWPS